MKVPSFVVFEGFKPYLVLSYLLGFSRRKIPLKIPGFPYAGWGPRVPTGAGIQPVLGAVHSCPLKSRTDGRAAKQPPSSC